MIRRAIVMVLSMILLATSTAPAFAIESFMMFEAANPDGPAGAPAPCRLNANRDGNCANYKWYNACAGYIWIFNGWVAGEGVGVRFGGPSQPCVNSSTRVKRGIYYFRNIVPSYGQTVDLFLDADCDGDGCPEGNLGAALNVDPGLRWNCIDYGACIPCDGVILRQLHDGGVAPTFATDGPFKTGCDPAHMPTHSYYYGIDGSTCVPWVGVPATDPDDFFMWLIVDSPGCVESSVNSSWGAVKGLYE